MTASLPTNQKEGDADRNSLFIVKDRGGLASANQSRAAFRGGCTLVIVRPYSTHAFYLTDTASVECPPVLQERHTSGHSGNLPSGHVWTTPTWQGLSSRVQYWWESPGRPRPSLIRSTRMYRVLEKQRSR